MIDRLDTLVTLISEDVRDDAIQSWLAAEALNGQVVAYPEGYDVSGKPYLVRLELAAPIAITALEGSFGPFRQGRTDRGMPREATFAPADRPGPFRIVVIAEVDGPGELRAASTSRITLRRDPKA